MSGQEFFLSFHFLEYKFIRFANKFSCLESLLKIAFHFKLNSEIQQKSYKKEYKAIPLKLKTVSKPNHTFHNKSIIRKSPDLLSLISYSKFRDCPSSNKAKHLFLNP